LHDGDDALVVPVGDASAVAAAVKMLIDDPDTAARVGASGAAAAAAYTEDAMVRGYLDFYARMAR
jgi:glycosyltransferase involved in cell wall biosynthesis